MDSVVPTPKDDKLGQSSFNNSTASMAEVEVISTCLVGAAAATAERSRIELTPWDLQFLQVGTIQKGLFFHKPTPQLSNSRLIHHLKTSLSSALAFIPPFAGRFATETNDEDSTCSVYVDCNNAGVEFVEAKATGVTVAAILDPTNDDPQILRSLFPLNGIRNCDGICKPLMGVQVTEFLDGYFIACTLNHTLADGTSFWNFFHSWSELSRGCHQISTTPILDRWFPDNTKPPIHLTKESIAGLGSFIPSPFAETVFHLSKESIAKLKEKANSEMGANNSISSLMSYMAHLWRSVTRARSLDSNEDVHILIIVGMRSRMPIPEGYLGNAAFFERVTARAGDVLEKGLGWVAWEMRKAVQKHTQEEVMNQYMSWVKAPFLLGKKTFLANALGISSSPRFNIYGKDFGWGKPVAVRSGMANKFDGKVTLFAGQEEGSVDIELCIHPSTLMGLRNDPEFLEYVTNSGN